MTENFAEFSYFLIATMAGLTVGALALVAGFALLIVDACAKQSPNLNPKSRNFNDLTQASASTKSKQNGRMADSDPGTHRQDNADKFRISP